MFRWALDSIYLAQSQEEKPENGSPLELGEVASSKNTDPQEPSQKPNSNMSAPAWTRVFPFFLSALFYLVGFLLVFSPLPLLLFFMEKGRKWAALAALTNCLIVVALTGPVNFLFYLIWVVVLTFILGELLLRRRSIELAVSSTLLGMFVLASSLAFGYCQYHHLNPVGALQTQISAVVDFWGRSVSVNSGAINPGDLDELKLTILKQFPSTVAIFSLILVWANLVLLLRINPKGLRDRLNLEASFIQQWKVPELVVWPTILSGGIFVLFGAGTVSDVALNVFKFLLALYAIQGLSILSYFFDVLGVRGLFRLVGFSISVFLMLPVVLSLGFFDLWFDFRSKFRQA